MELDFIVAVYLVLFILGLSYGSFVASWVWRAQSGNLTWFSRSQCPGCGRALRWYETVPVVSFLALRGRCAGCRQPIGRDYLWIEILSGGLFLLLAFLHTGGGALAFRSGAFASVWFARDLLFTMVLLVIFLYDYRYYIIPSGVVYAGAVLGLLANIFLFGVGWQAILWGVALGFGFFAAQYYISRGRWVGGGDVRLGAMLGAWFGPGVLVCIFLAYLLGAAVALPLLALKRASLKSALPFGAFLAAGALITIVYGSDIMGWYAGLIAL